MVEPWENTIELFVWLEERDDMKPSLASYIITYPTPFKWFLAEIDDPLLTCNQSSCTGTKNRQLCCPFSNCNVLAAIVCMQSVAM